MTHNDSHLMALIDELKQSRDNQLAREAKLIKTIEHLINRIERLEKQTKQESGTVTNLSWWVEKMKRGERF